MRYAIVSDIHANLQAWNAVLADIGSVGADRILCLGDVVGYGPDPVAVLQSVHRHVHNLVLGNHDAVVCGKMSAAVFNERARQMIFWTRTRLGRRAGEFFSTLPLTLAGDGFRCAHGSFVNPGAFDYILEPEDALASWNAVPEPLLFVGHSHAAALFVIGRSGTPHRIEAQDFTLEPGKRYIVNVGSVGSPRDGDARASYALYDTERATVEFRRIPFDFDAFRAAVAAAGLDPANVPALRRDPRANLAAVREALDFSPPAKSAEAVRNAVEVGDVERSLRRTASRWRRFAVAAAALAVVCTVGAFALARSQAAAERPAQEVVPAEPYEAISANNVHSLTTGNLPVFPACVDSDGGLRPWRVHYGDRKAQSVEMAQGTAAGGRTPLPVAVLKSSDRSLPFALEAPAITREANQQFQLQGQLRHGQTFKGELHVVVDIQRDSGEWVSNFETAKFAAKQRKTPEVVEFTRKTKFPNYVRAFRVRLAGEFSGECRVELLACQLAK